MAMKRKFDNDDVTPTKSKQMKLVPFPNYEPDNDAVMTEAEPLYLPHHIRIPSNVSSASSDSSGTSSPGTSLYPSFDIYPHPFFNPDGSVDPNSHNYSNYSAQSITAQNVGLLQPNNSFQHHGYQNFESPAHPDSTVNVQCGASANSAAPSQCATATSSRIPHCHKTFSDRCAFDL